MHHLLSILLEYVIGCSILSEMAISYSYTYNNHLYRVCKFHKSRVTEFMCAPWKWSMLLCLRLDLSHKFENKWWNLHSSVFNSKDLFCTVGRVRITSLFLFHFWNWNFFLTFKSYLYINIKISIFQHRDKEDEVHLAQKPLWLYWDYSTAILKFHIKSQILSPLLEHPSQYWPFSGWGMGRGYMVRCDWPNSRARW